VLYLEMGHFMARWCQCKMLVVVYVHGSSKPGWPLYLRVATCPWSNDFCPATNDFVVAYC